MVCPRCGTALPAPTAPCPSRGADPQATVPAACSPGHPRIQIDDLGHAAASRPFALDAPWTPTTKAGMPVPGWTRQLAGPQR